MQVRWYRRSAHGPARFGIVVKKGAGGAVLRNRTKRQLRSIIYSITQHVPLNHGVDVVLIAREPLYGKKFHAASSEVRKIMEDYGI